LKKRDETLSIIVVIVDGASPAAKMTRLTRMRHSLRLISKSIIAVGQRSFQTCAAFCLLAQQMNGRAIPRTATPRAHGLDAEAAFYEIVLVARSTNSENALSFRPSRALVREMLT
jgi:hypothetical protein